MKKPIISFTRDTEGIMFELNDDPTLLEIILAASKLKKIIIESVEDMDTDTDDKDLSYLMILNEVDKNHIWKEELLN